MENWIIILLLIMFGLFEFLASFSFTFKIKMINDKKFNNAAALGAFSTMLFMTLSMTAPIVANDINGVWFIFAGAGMMALGNIASILVMIPVEKSINKRKEKRGEK